MQPTVQIEAPNLNIDQINAGVDLSLYLPAEYRPVSTGWIIDLEPRYPGHVEAVIDFVHNPPALNIVDPGLKALADTYLSVKACYEAIPAPPNEGDDPWVLMRADYLARMHAAYAALGVAGGPV